MYRQPVESFSQEFPQLEPRRLFFMIRSTGHPTPRELFAYVLLI
jgi:hypothetical protein